ncbi:sensor histidine kinase [Janthinobacterium fluminis]|uniref:Histidine kinase n=1 Tax=Janthinobacterium fluminis TaxID=2987524 RepID=A0ABT5K051_9BURK|nr:histidine kinase [Janthinobacterium fluminis]MDC8758342.1 histidine kinase [Janthinobacterium fluminis]
MPGPFSSRRGVALYALVCLSLGVALAAVIVMAADAHWGNALLFALPLTLVYAVAAGFSAFYLCRAYPLSGRPPLAIAAVMSAAALVAGLLWQALAQFWNGLSLLTELRWAGIALTPALSALLFGLGVLLYALALALHYLALEFMRATAAEQGEMQSQLAAQEAQLRMLRTQIDPHFLFNSLNSISALTSANPAGAREMTVQLASFYRRSLGMEAHKKVPLGEEMQLIRHFVAIEQVRFGARLQVEEALDEAAAACLVPPMLIQPLVENAVKHGVCKMTEGGTIRIAARRAGSILRISVLNPVDADLPAARPGGIGLDNVRQRLAGAYGHEASIHWARRGASFGVDIAMPAQTSED